MCSVIFHAFRLYADLFYFKINFFKKFLSGIPSVSNSLDSDQAQGFVEPDLGLTCLQRLSTDETSRLKQRGK